MSARICPSCGDALPLQTGRGGRRRYCLKCSPPRFDPRKKARPVATVAPALTFDSGDVQRAAPNVTRAVRRELEAAGVLAHWAGQVALVLARRIDADQEAGAALAALVKVLRDILATAMEAAAAAAPEPDLLEQIRARVLSPVPTPNKPS